MGRTYSANIVGESYRQAAIARTTAGDAVRFLPDPGNPHDPRAVKVVTARGLQIGFLPRDGWLTDVVLDQGVMIRATVQAINPPDARRPHAAVVLRVELG